MTDARPPAGAPRPVGATPVGARKDDDRRKKGLLIGGALLAALLALLLLLSQCGSDDVEGSADPANQTSAENGAGGSADADSDASGSSSDASASGADGAGAGSGAGPIVTADGESVLEVAAEADPAALTGLVDQPATGTRAEVLSVPADEGFWVGTSDEERVWVQLTGEAGESPYQVKEGDSVDFEGTVVAHDETFAEEVGVDAAEGAEQLNAQGAHLEVVKSDVRLSE